MLAPERFIDWLRTNEQKDKYGNIYQYHPRSDSHSVALCRFIVDDLMASCDELRKDLDSRKVVYKINCRYLWAKSNKTKTLDLAVGPPAQALAQTAILVADACATNGEVPGDVYISIEAKAVMTEHGKSQPRLFDELNSSHEIVHKGRPDAIAGGIACINIADTFVSPLRQRGFGNLDVTAHRQPHVAERMVQHLRGLPICNSIGENGFDAFCAFVVDVNNQGRVVGFEEPPAPQPGDIDHYATFIKRISALYKERFA